MLSNFNFSEHSKILQKKELISELGRFPFHSLMCATVEELRQILEADNLLDNCTGTHEAVTRWVVAFRESNRFQEPLSFSKIGSVLGVDAKTVSNQWPRFQKFGLEDGDGGRPTIPSPEQLVPSLITRSYNSTRCNQL
jgi:hypothetical protein